MLLLRLRGGGVCVWRGGVGGHLRSVCGAHRQVGLGLRLILVEDGAGMVRDDVLDGRPVDVHAGVSRSGRLSGLPLLSLRHGESGGRTSRRVVASKSNANARGLRHEPVTAREFRGEIADDLRGQRGGSRIGNRASLRSQAQLPNRGPRRRLHPRWVVQAVQAPRRTARRTTVLRLFPVRSRSFSDPRKSALMCVTLACPNRGDLVAPQSRRALDDVHQAAPATVLCAAEVTRGGWSRARPNARRRRRL